MSTNPLPITARNRANATHSTGPKTEAGKQRSSLNALRHGLTGHTIVLPAEDLAAYQGILEEQLVQSLADTSWRLNRIPALENNLLALGFSEHSDSIVTEHPEAHAALVIAQALREQTRAFTALSLYGQRLSCQFEKTLKQLRDLESERRQLPENKAHTEAGFVFSTTAAGPASLPVGQCPIGPARAPHHADVAHHSSPHAPRPSDNL